MMTSGQNNSNQPKNLQDNCVEAESLSFALADVEQFHEKFGVPVMSSPWIPNLDRLELRHSLILEESTELLTAIETENITEIADGIADVIYVALGTALEFGIPIAAVWAEVHRTNMLKYGGATRPDGKILKPSSWQPPRIAEILEAAK